MDLALALRLDLGVGSGGVSWRDTDRDGARSRGSCQPWRQDPASRASIGKHTETQAGTDTEFLQVSQLIKHSSMSSGGAGGPVGLGWQPSGPCGVNMTLE